MFLKHVYLPQAIGIAHKCDLFKLKYFIILIIYYFLTIVNTAMDSIGMMLLVNLITGRIELIEPHIMSLSKWILEFISVLPDIKSYYLLAIFFIALRAVTLFVIVVFEGMLYTFLRSELQRNGFQKVIRGNWELLRSGRIGSLSGAIIEETTLVAKYLTSIVRIFYFITAFLISAFFTFLVSIEISIILALSVLPMYLGLRLVFKYQALASQEQTKSRQGLAADVVERFSNLFQIKVENQPDFHTKIGLRKQQSLNHQENLIWIYQALISSFQLILPIVGLFAYYLWSTIKGISFQESLVLIAGVGVLGSRTASYADGLLAVYGNLSRLSGSIIPIHNLFSIPSEKTKIKIPETVIKIEMKNIGYSYNSTNSIENINLTAYRGHPLILRGPSGSGKTTIANILAGLYDPKIGTIEYIGSSEKLYSGLEYKPRTGYVTQDIQLFQGTIRENLVSYFESKVSDEYLWNCLKHAGAAEFIEKMGGLDAEIAEAGRSLSGGQKRRLGIARVLVINPDLLILDEVTSGLEEERRIELMNTISTISKEIITVIITHDPPMEYFFEENCFSIINKE